MTLPRFIGIKSKATNKFVWADRVDAIQVLKGSLFVDGEEIVSPCAKFALDPSSIDRKFFHIRCCYNNKYLVKQAEETFYNLVATAKEKEEDKSKWSSTLFEPIMVDSSNQTLCFRHVQSGCYVSVYNKSFLYIHTRESVEPKDEDISFIVTDWEPLMLLPKRVAFKGDDGKYLGIYREATDTTPYVTFLRGEIDDKRFWHKVITLNDGSINIFSNDAKKYWNTLNNTWVETTSDEPSSKGDHSDNTWFRPINVDKDNIALRNINTDSFCSRVLYVDWPDGFSAKSSLLTQQAFVGVEEPVQYRLIFNVDFPLSDPGIYNKGLIKVTDAQAANATNEFQIVSVELPYTEWTNITWSRTTFNTGVNTRVQAAFPNIPLGGDQIFNDISGEINWGEFQTLQHESKKMYRVALKPMTKVTVSLFATKGSCDNPFSYTQRDILTDGSIETIQKNDGLFTVTSLFDFKFETKEETF